MILKQFYQNEPMREAVYAYLIENLRQDIISRAFQGGEVKDLAEAKKSIDRAFRNLEAQYAKTHKINSDPR
jgi:hypothetical protein